jgi:L-lactate dehydrogenase complex protein LldF
VSNVTFDDRLPFPEPRPAGLADAQQRRNLRRATTTIRGKRDAVVAERDDWEALRLAGEAIKRRTMRHLDTHLERFEAAVQAAGGTVHWARDAADANRCITDIVLGTGVREVVKVKSLATDEIGLNEALGRVGVQALETDLAELIVQLARSRRPTSSSRRCTRTDGRSATCSAGRSTTPT